MRTIPYGYGDASWSDLLTSIGGQSLTADEIGNLLSDGTWTYTWQHGRQLAGMSKTGMNIAYGYDSDGKRITKTVNGTTYNYHYLGDQLVELTWGGNKLHFTYDSTGPLATTLGAQNPLRYRGYVYDTETGLYYLQSRYYNPGWGRFINADNQVSAGSDLIGMNLFAYCENNPCNYADPTGHFLSAIIASVAAKIAAAIVAAVVSVAITVVVRPLLKKAAQQVTNAAAKMYETAKNAVMTAIEKVRSQSKEATRDTTEEKVAPLERPKFCYWEAMRVKVKGGTEVLVGRELTFTEARVRVSMGLDLMCANEDAEKAMLFANGYVHAVGPEIHGGDGYYPHFHPKRHTHTHIWFYP